jgi:hypothetical protein
MLPPIRTIKEYGALRRDVEAQRPAMVSNAERHGLPVSELRPFSQGTHLVWHTGTHR